MRMWGKMSPTTCFLAKMVLQPAVFNFMTMQRSVILNVKGGSTVEALREAQPCPDSPFYPGSILVTLII